MKIELDSIAEVRVACKTFGLQNIVKPEDAWKTLAEALEVVAAGDVGFSVTIMLMPGEATVLIRPANLDGKGEFVIFTINPKLYGTDGLMSKNVTTKKEVVYKTVQDVLKRILTEFTEMWVLRFERLLEDSGSDVATIELFTEMLKKAAKSKTHGVCPNCKAEDYDIHCMCQNCGLPALFPR